MIGMVPTLLSHTCHHDVYWDTCKRALRHINTDTSTYLSRCYTFMIVTVTICRVFCDSMVRYLWCFVILYLSWAWSNHCRWFVCLVNIYKHLLSGKGHSFHMEHPLITCKNPNIKSENHSKHISILKFLLQKFRVWFIVCKQFNIAEQDWQQLLLYLSVTLCLVFNSQREHDRDC